MTYSVFLWTVRATMIIIMEVAKHRPTKTPSVTSTEGEKILHSPHTGKQRLLPLSKWNPLEHSSLLSVVFANILLSGPAMVWFVNSAVSIDLRGGIEGRGNQNTIFITVHVHTCYTVEYPSCRNIKSPLPARGHASLH